MIYVKPAVLSESEYAMVGHVTDREFNARYRPWLVPVHLRTEGQGGAGRGVAESTGESSSDSQDDAELPAAHGQGEAQA
jgi:hypothetical protein